MIRHARFLEVLVWISKRKIHNIQQNAEFVAMFKEFHYAKELKQGKLEFLEDLKGVTISIVQQHQTRMIFKHYKHVGLIFDNVTNMISS